MKKKFLKISKNILILAPVLFVIVFLIIPEIAGADIFVNAAERIKNTVQGVATAVAIIGICIAAIMFITAGGDEKKITLAKTALTYGIVGAAIAVSAGPVLDWARGLLRGGGGGTPTP